MPNTTAADLPDTGRWGRIPAWWLEHPDLDADGLAVLAALSTFADEHGVCWPSQSTLAAKLKRSRPTINRILQGLNDIGLVSIEHRKGRNGARLSCLYRLRVEQDGKAVAKVTARPVQDLDRDNSAVNAPCPATSQEHLHSEQIPDSLASGRRVPVRDVPSDWMPCANDMAWAKARHAEIDFVRHVEGFVLRCQAHGYRYRDISAAWRAWLAQDAAAGKAPVARNMPFAGGSAPTPSSTRGTAAELRLGAWAAAAAELRQRTTMSWS
ncbi:helix-turn-helix domain-containing protein [Azospirillum soli]|uniref:helix-turn-helix domain-containing protein n=1 Tax=Azospirillum soli TaxID=1304799 RepID=UPI001AE79857|nr:helix-turn-helix domain-containing protein [Azospirillum soli]MBP2315495.1 biotin operon repressor [Azospirillum soli]